MISLAAVFVGSTRGSELSGAATKVWRTAGVLCLLVGVTVAVLGSRSL